MTAGRRPWSARHEREAMLTLCGLLFILVEPGPARADETLEAMQQVIELDQRMHIMALELTDPLPSSPGLADRRVLEAEALYLVRDHDAADAILADVVLHWPASQAAHDAAFLMGQARFQTREYRSSRGYYEITLAALAGSRRDEQALGHLVEIALRTEDFDRFEDYLAKLTTPAPRERDPAVAYARAKYLYFRNQMEEALPIFAAIRPWSPYYFQARYFLATIFVTRGELDQAMGAYRDLLLLRPTSATAREVHELSHLALGRILYQREEWTRAVQRYEAVEPHSKHQPDALFELGWTWIKSEAWAKAYRSFERFLSASPGDARAPGVTLVMGQLKLRMKHFYVARDFFVRARNDLEPAHRELQETTRRMEADLIFRAQLVAASLEGRDLSRFLPAVGAQWARGDPEVSRIRGVLGELADLHQALRSAAHTVGKLERTLASTAKVEPFADLMRARGGSIEVRRRLGDIRQEVLRRRSDRDSRVLSRIEAVERQILAFHARIDSQADTRRKSIEASVAAERGELESAASKIEVHLSEARSLGAEIVVQGISRLDDRLYDLLVQAEVGLIDVAWALKDQRTRAVRDLVLERNRELRAAAGEMDRLEEEMK